MNELFLKIINMSISASWLILAVLICRLVLKKAPKWVNVLLWGIVAVRLLFPFSIESALSLIPSSETISPEIIMDPSPAINTGIPAINNVVNPVISQSFAPSPAASANPLQIWIPVLAAAWVMGVVGVLAYTAATYWRLRRKVSTAIILRDNILQSENVSSPFVLGIIKPKIYLPFQLNEQDMGHVIAHELAHIRRRDHWWKPLGFLLLAVYWFNPLMWLAYVLLCRDIELACDEKVIKHFSSEQKADYTQALLTCSISRHMIAACPLAFGEVGIKERVKSVMHYKKPAFWILVLAVAACTVVAVCFLTNPAPSEDPSDKQESNTAPAPSEDPSSKQESSVVKWFDYLETPEEMPWDGYLESNRPEFPGVTFRWCSGEMEAVTETGIEQLYTGMPIWSVYFYDLTGDGLPELCSTLSMGSGIIDTRIRVYDYANGVCYELEDRGSYDYTLRLDNEDGCLYVDKKPAFDNVGSQSGILVSSGRLSFSEGYIHMGGYDDMEMIPSTANMQGIFDAYLFVPLGNSTYRYERSSADPSSVTIGELLYSFTEKADPYDVEWNIYEVKGSPSHRVVYAAAGDDSVYLYQYSPSKKSDPNALSIVKENGCILMEDGTGTYGAEQWNEFYEMTQNGNACSVKVAHYRTLDPDSCDETYYEAYKEDYPCLYVFDLIFDGSVFTLSWTEQGVSYHQQYKYLMKYEDPTPWSSVPKSAVTRYVLTNDNTVTWDELLPGLFRSQFEDYIDCFSIYTDIK